MIQFLLHTTYDYITTGPPLWRQYDAEDFLNVLVPRRQLREAFSTHPLFRFLDAVFVIMWLSICEGSCMNRAHCTEYVPTGSAMVSPGEHVERRGAVGANNPLAVTGPQFLILPD